jgi:NitT/TauT family transport system substrate-binding protein
MRMKRELIAALLAFFGFTTAQPASALDQMKVAIGGRGMGETGISERGQMQGIFRKHGIELEIFYTAGTGETQQAIISGSADIGIAVGILGALGAYAKGAPIRVIGASYTGNDQYWYVPGDSPIRRPQDTNGKTVAYSTNGSPTQSAVLQAQKHFGTSFKPTAAGAAQTTYTQVMSRQIDVGWAGAPFLIEELEAGKVRMVWRGAEVPALNHQTARIIIANADLLARKKDLVARYMDAYRETVDWLASMGTPVVADYAAYSNISVPAATRTMRDFLTREQMNPDTIADIEGSMATAVEFKYLPATLSAQQVSDFLKIPPRK